jgi:ectoine hydroxylase-related dioxygenase (phytanoyl-CoA dioxygenase family)
MSLDSGNRDLSAFHHPVGDLFSKLDSIENSQSFQLDDEQLAFYDKWGYLSGVRILSTKQVDALRDELSAFSEPDHPGHELWYEYHSNESTDPQTVLFHALGAWRIGAGFHDLLWNPAFTIPASQLLGGAVRFWHDQLFCKPPRHGGVVSWHQDYSYWTRTTPMAHLSCWIGLDDSTVDNGCLHYIPGSHRWNLLSITGLAGEMDAIREALSEEQWHDFKNPVPIELKAGECAFHHPLMVHGSFENRTEQPRRATVINVVRDGVCSESNEPLLNGTTVIPPGESLGGQFYPLLFDGDKATTCGDL